MAILGMRGTGSLASGERPKNYRQGILLMFPNGDAPLTGMLSQLREQSVNDPQFFWFEKGLPVARATITAANTTTNALPTLGDDISANDANRNFLIRVTPEGGSAGDTSIFKPGHILYNEVGNENYLVLKKVTLSGTDCLLVQRDVGNKYDVTGSSSAPAVTGAAVGSGDTISIVGSGFPEGAPVGQAISYLAAKHYNYTQIHRTPLKLTRTAKMTRLRWDSTGPYMEAKREALQIHGTELERAFFFSERSENTSATNADSPIDVTSSATPNRTMRGLLNWLPTATTSSVSVHTNLTSYNSGVLTETIMDSFLEEVFRYGSSEKAAFVGSTALNVINQLVKNKSELQAVPTDQTYGRAVTRWLSPFGSLMLINHPLLSHNSVWRKDLYVVDMDKLTYRYITDTTFLRNRQNPGDDASTDEFLTECSLECHFSGATPDSSDGLSSIAAPAAHGRLSGIASYGG